MTVQTEHKDYAETMPQWELMRLSAKGQSAIKKQQDKYLPIPNGILQITNRNMQQKMYDAYLMRAEYPNWIQDSIKTSVGLIGKQEPEIEIPPQLADMLENATADGFSLKQLFYRSCADVVLLGRKVLLVDVDADGKPYIATYEPENLINWQTRLIDGRQDLSLVVLTEERNKPNQDRFTHETETVYRVLSLDENGYCKTELLNGQGLPLSLGTDGLGSEIYEAYYKDSTGRNLEYIPIVVTGSTDNTVDIDIIPLQTMANASLKYYQLSADYFQELHHTAHPQPYIIGVDEEAMPKITGSYAAWVLPMESSVGYLEIAGNGIEAKRQAMHDQRNAANESGAKVMDTNGQESGDARKARQNDQYASLYSVVVTVAEGIEQALKYAAELIGASPEQVTFIVKPDFSETMQVDVNQAMSLVNMQVLSRESLFELVQTGKIPERDWTKERLLLDDIESGDLVE